MYAIKIGIFRYFYKEDGTNWDIVSPTMVNLIEQIINDNKTDTTYQKEWFLFDTPYIYPKDIKRLQSEDVLFIYLGYVKIKIEEKILQMQKYD